MGMCNQLDLESASIPLISTTLQALALQGLVLLIVITGGEMAYTRQDGVKIIPIGTLKDFAVFPGASLSRLFIQNHHIHIAKRNEMCYIMQYGCGNK